MSGNVTAPAFFFERSEAGLGEGEGRLAEAEREAIVHIIDVLERDSQQGPELPVVNGRLGGGKGWHRFIRRQCPHAAAPGPSSRWRRGLSRGGLR